MRKHVLLFSAAMLLFLSGSAFSLTNFWYNGYAIDNFGQILPSTTIDVRITITNSGGTQFQEIHSAVTTDQFGSYVVEVGGGTLVTGNLGTITTTAETRIKSEARVGAGIWVVSTNASLAMVNINTVIMPGFIELPQNYIIMGDAYNNGQAVQVGGDLTGTNNGGVADLQISPSTVGSTEIIDNSIVDADVNSTAAIQVTKLQSGAANQFLLNNGTNAWAEFNRDATLLGDGVGTALGIDLAHANSWSGQQIFNTANPQTPLAPVADNDLTNKTYVDTQDNMRWSIIGNSGLTAGTNFLGTTDAVDLVFKVNNLEYGRLTAALDNISIGRGAMTSSPTGGANSAYGHNALQFNSTGHTNSALGFGALTNNTTGIYNTGLGGWALYSNDNGERNVAVGAQALRTNQTGSYNTAVGELSLNNNVSGFYNTVLGARADISADGLTNATALGFGAIATASNQVRLGNAGVTSLYSMGATAGVNIQPNMYVNPLTGQIMQSTTLDRTFNNVIINGTLTQNNGGQVSFSGNVDAANGIDVTGNATVTGNIDVNGWIMNSSLSNNQAVYINDYLQISNTISNPTAQNNGRIYIGDDFEVSGSTYLGDANTDNVYFVADVNSNIIPNTDIAFDLGTAAQRWRDIYSGGTIFGNNAQLVNLNVTGSTTLGDAITDPVVINGTIFNNLGPVIINDAITQSGGGAVNLSGPTTINNTLSQTGGGQVSFSGNIDAAAGLDVIGATTMNGTLTQTGGQVTFNGNVNANAGLDIIGLTTHDGSITQSSGSAQFLNTTVNGTFSQTGGGAVNLSGPTTINNTLTQTGGGQVTFSGNVDAASGIDVTGNATVTGNIDVNGYIMNSTASNNQAVYINDYLQISNTISNPTAQNNGRIYIGDDFEVSGSTYLGDANTDNVYFVADVNSNIIPNTDIAFDLGTAAQRWRDIYSGGTIYGNNAQLVNLTVTGITTLGDAVADPIYLNGTISSTLGPVIIDDQISQTGGGQVSFSGNVNADNGLDIVGLTTHDGSITQSAGSAQFLNTTVNGTFDQTGGGAVNISGPATFTNTITQTGNGLITLTGNIDAFGGIDITGATTMNGILTQTNGQVTFNGNIDANGGLDVTGASTFNGTMTQTGGGAVQISGPTTITNTITQTGGGLVSLTGNVDAFGGVDVTGNVTVTGDIDVNGWIMNSSSSNNQAVYINDYLQISNTISNPTNQNTGRVFVGDDFEVTGTSYLDSAIIHSLGDTASHFGTHGQVPIASGTGHWAWQDIAGSFAIATDGITIVGDGTTANPIRTNDSVITSNVATFNAGTIASVFNYTGGTDDLVITNATTGRRIWVIHSSGGGILRVAPSSQLAVGTAKAYIYSGTAWIEL